MCGLFGYTLFKAPNKTERQQLKDMVTILSLAMDARGGDSWGFVSDGEISRGLGDILSRTNLVDMSESQTLIAHCRWATQGEVVKQNSHPLEHEGIVGCHNGVVFNSFMLDRKYEEYEVDSSHIFAALAKGRKTTEISAYGTLEWYEKDDPKKVFLSHFNGGDLAVSQFDLGIVWASTKASVEKALGFAEFEEQPFKIKENRVYRLEEGHLHKTGRRLFFASRSWHGATSTITPNNKPCSVTRSLSEGYWTNMDEDVDYPWRKDVVKFHGPGQTKEEVIAFWERELEKQNAKDPAGKTAKTDQDQGS